MGPQEHSDGHDPQTRASEEKLAKDVAQISPEGRPAEPSVGRKKFGMLWIGLVFGVIVLGVIVGSAWQPIAGVVVGGIGLISLILNPELLAGLQRTEDRDKVKDRQSRNEM